MRTLPALLLTLTLQPALACEEAVCLADPEALSLTRIITFEGLRTGHGPGHQVRDLLVLEGATFGERFAGQSIAPEGEHDAVTGQPLGPLVLMAGARGQNLSVVYFNGNNVLNGYGPAGFPRRNAQGEGAIAFLFDQDQSALSFQIRGGEDGQARAMFLARDGSLIATLDLPPAGEYHYGFLRAGGVADIAGVVLTNTDPEGIALDNIRFERQPDLS